MSLCPQAENSIVKQVQAEKDILLAQVRGQMCEMQRQHAGMASELQRKLDWWGPHGLLLPALPPFMWVIEQERCRDYNMQHCKETRRYPS